MSISLCMVGTSALFSELIKLSQMGKIQNLMKIVFLFFISKIIRKHWLFYGFLMTLLFKEGTWFTYEEVKER